jgi:hypothetical protein
LHNDSIAKNFFKDLDAKSPSYIGEKDTETKKFDGRVLQINSQGIAFSILRDGSAVGKILRIFKDGSIELFRNKSQVEYYTDRELIYMAYMKVPFTSTTNDDSIFSQVWNRAL